MNQRNHNTRFPKTLRFKILYMHFSDCYAINIIQIRERRLPGTAMWNSKCCVFSIVKLVFKNFEFNIVDIYHIHQFRSFIRFILWLFSLYYKSLQRPTPGGGGGDNLSWPPLITMSIPVYIHVCSYAPPNMWKEYFKSSWVMDRQCSNFCIHHPVI